MLLIEWCIINYVLFFEKYIIEIKTKVKSNPLSHCLSTQKQVASLLLQI